jgi:hypothetical protein
MNTKNKLMAMLVAVVLGLSMVGAMGLLFVGQADADKPNNPNLWGKEASELARDDDEGEDDESGSEMGEHARESDLSEEQGRVGVGNIDEELEELTGQEVEDHPSGVVDFLCGGADQPNDCPEDVPD